MIDIKKNYKRLGTDDIFTGQQINNLLELASKEMQAIILLSIIETDSEPTNKKSKYGVS